MTAKSPIPAATARNAGLQTTINARVLRHDPDYGLSTLFFGDGELRVPMVDASVDSGVSVTIDARDVSIALSRPMDVSITNRLPGTIVDVEPLERPFVRVTFDLGATRLHALVTTESVERLALEPGLRAWAMIKTVAIGSEAVHPTDVPKPRRWSVVDKKDRERR
jgi:molybdate transport system ATP-binding protein